MDEYVIEMKLDAEAQARAAALLAANVRDLFTSYIDDDSYERRERDTLRACRQAEWREEGAL